MGNRVRNLNSRVLIEAEPNCGILWQIATFRAAAGGDAHATFLLSSCYAGVFPILAWAHAKVLAEGPKQVVGARVAGLGGDIGDAVVGGFQAQGDGPEAGADEFLVDAAAEFAAKPFFQHAAVDSGGGCDIID